MPLAWAFAVERVTGIEPALSAWEADVLPLNYTRAAPGPSGRRLAPTSYRNRRATRRGAARARPGASSASRGPGRARPAGVGSLCPGLANELAQPVMQLGAFPL